MSRSSEQPSGYNWIDPIQPEIHWESQEIRDLMASIDTLGIDRRDHDQPSPTHFRYVWGDKNLPVGVDVVHFDAEFLYLRSPIPVDVGAVLVLDKERIPAHILDRAPAHIHVKVEDVHHGKRQGEDASSVFILKVRPQ